MRTIDFEKEVVKKRLENMDTLKKEIMKLPNDSDLMKKVVKTNVNNFITVIEGVVTNSEIAFYTYDLESGKEIRLPFFVDGIEKIPTTEKTTGGAR